MTDNEIIKAFECCIPTYNKNCEECLYHKYKSQAILAHSCSEYLLKDILDLINRLNAENDRLKSLVLEFMDCVSKWSAKHDNDLSDEINKIPVMDKCKCKVKEIKTEAYKEFAERLKSRVYKGGVHPTVDDEFITEIDNLLKKWGVSNG